MIGTKKQEDETEMAHRLQFTLLKKSFIAAAVVLMCRDAAAAHAVDRAGSRGGDDCE